MSTQPTKTNSKPNSSTSKDSSSGYASQIKIVVVGDGSVGKTCMLYVYTNDTFPEEYVPTVFANSVVSQTLVDGRTVQLALWDTAGQEDYDRLRPLSYPNTDVFLVLFSVVSPTSLENVVDKWYPELYHHTRGTVPLILVGTKTDLREDSDIIQQLADRGQDTVSIEQAEKVRSQIKAVKYLECSAKMNEGVKNVFLEATKVALQHRENKKKKRTTKKCIIL